MNSLEEIEKCIRKSESNTHTLCHRRANHSTEWMFVDIEHAFKNEVQGLKICKKCLLGVLERLRSAEEALDCIHFDEPVPTIGKSYWIDEYDLKKVKSHFQKYPSEGEK